MRKTVCKRLWKFAASINPNPSRLVPIENKTHRAHKKGRFRLEWRGFKAIYRGLKKRYARFPERRARVPR